MARDRIPAPGDEFTAALAAAVDPAEAARLLACLEAGRQAAHRSARAAWGEQERHSRRAMAAELDTIAADARLAAAQSGLPVLSTQRGPDRAMTPDMIRSLPPGRALALRGSKAPVVATLPMAWKDPTYRQARRRGRAIAVLPAVAAVAGVTPLVVPVPVASKASSNGHGHLADVLPGPREQR